MNDEGAKEAVIEGAAQNAPERQGRLTEALNRMKVWLRFLRIRVAHAVLLPELSPIEAHDLRATVHEDSALSSGYILMCALSAGIATLGLLQSSTAVVIGAMLISPLMGPIASLGFGFASIDGKRIREAARVVMVGAAIGVLTGMLITWLSPIRNATPEILARTQPTLLDLAVALFSGIAGGYATVIGKGGTAIGVAIATALMPPLATLGYGLGVLQIRFAMGALLLFLTNLAAIAFAFAVIARLSGAARPLTKVEWTPRYVAILVIVFLALATPLSMTLVKIRHETMLRSEARTAILEATGKNSSRIAQIDVITPLFGESQIDAVVITTEYGITAEKDAEKLLEDAFGEKVTIHLQQVIAADMQSRTRAMIDAAMERTAAGIAADVPPIDRIRGSIGLPTQGFWTNRAEKMVFVEPVPAPGWTLADYRETERRANGKDDIWVVRVVPPAMAQLRVKLAAPSDDAGTDGTEPNGAGARQDAPQQADDAIPADLAIWALRRWGMTQVTLTAPNGDATKALVKTLADAGIAVPRIESPADESAVVARIRGQDSAAKVAVIGVYAQSPTKLAEAAAAAKAAAEKDAAEKAAKDAAAQKANGGAASP